jgi:hypothetical protein
MVIIGFERRYGGSAYVYYWLHDIMTSSTVLRPLLRHSHHRYLSQTWPDRKDILQKTIIIHKHETITTASISPIVSPYRPLSRDEDHEPPGRRPRSSSQPTDPLSFIQQLCPWHLPRWHQSLPRRCLHHHQKRSGRAPRRRTATPPDRVLTLDTADVSSRRRWYRCRLLRRLC